MLALKKIYPEYEDNAPTMSESAFNRMTYPRWVHNQSTTTRTEYKYRTSGLFPSPQAQYQHVHQVLRGEAGRAVLEQGDRDICGVIYCHRISRSIYSVNSDDSASHDSEEELDALELEQN